MNWTNLDFEKLANALLILIVGIGGHFSITQVRKKGAAPPANSTVEAVELAGAVIDSKDAKMLSDSFDRASLSMIALQQELTEHRKILDRNNECIENVRDTTLQVNQEMRNLANALLITRK